MPDLLSLSLIIAGYLIIFRIDSFPSLCHSLARRKTARQPQSPVDDR